MRKKSGHPPAAALRKTFWASVAFLFCGSLLAETVRLTLPAAASLLGAAPFYSDVRVFNRSYWASVRVTATYRCFIGNPCPHVAAHPRVAAQTIFMLEPRESRAFNDMAATTFSAPDTAGGVEFQYVGEPGQVVVSSRLYSTYPIPTVGMQIPALEDWQANPTSILTSIRHGGPEPGFRTNVGAFNPGGAEATVTFTIFDGRAQVGSPVERVVAGHSGVQVSRIFEMAGAGDTTTTNAVIIASATSPVFSYAAVIDNATTDPVFVVGVEDLPQQAVTPVATRTPGEPEPPATRTPTLPGPTATQTPTLPGPTATYTPTVPAPTATRTPTVPGPTATRTPTLPGPTATRTPTVPGPTATRTPTVPAPTATRTPTAPAPTATRTPTVPVPTATRTPTVPAPTATRTPTPPAPTTHTVFVGGPGGSNVFIDEASGTTTTTIHVGDTVHWVWVDNGHDTVSGTNCAENGIWASQELDTGATFDHTFNQAGNFPYFCNPHCDDGMTGAVIVNP